MNIKYLTLFLCAYSFNGLAMYNNSGDFPDHSIMDKSPSFKLSKAYSTDSFFDKKAENVWTLASRDALLKASETLFNEVGEWKGKEQCPRVIKYLGSLDNFRDDLQLIKDKWLKLEPLKYFYIENEKSENFQNYKIIRSQYEKKEAGENIYKLIWLSRESTNRHYEFFGAQDFPPNEWLEKHKNYYSL